MTELPRVLIVDDEDGICHAIERVLARHARIEECGDAASARTLIRSTPFDLAFIDVRLGEDDGFELMAELQQVRPELDVVVMTGSVQDMDQKLVRTLREKAFFFLPKPFGRELLLTVFDRWQELRLLSARDAEQRIRLEGHRDEARRFQRSLLPPRSARLAGVALHAHFEPCEDLSGDLYDFAPVPSGSGVALLVADVSGHGVAAAMLSGIIKAAFQSAHADGFEPLAVLKRLRDGLAHLQADRFVTAMAVRIDTERNSLEFASAGHHDGLLWSRDSKEIVTLPHTGPMICSAIPNGSWTSDRLAMRPGDQLLLMSDGVEETRDGHDEMFGRARTEAVIHGGAEGFELLEGICTATAEHAGGRPIDDDHTLLLARLVGDL